MNLTGGCYCGAVRYEAQGPATECTMCHCRDCQRVSGAPALAWFTVPTSRLRYTQGAPVEFSSSERVWRGFCGQCGTTLTWRHEDIPDLIDVTTCSLDDPELTPPRDHTFASSQVRWLHLCDELPRYPRTRAEGMGGPA